MHDVLSGLAGSADRGLDATLAAVVLAVCVAELVFAAPLGATLTTELAAVETFGAVAVALRRRWPLGLALAFAAASFLPGLALGSRWVNAPSDALLITTVVLAYTVGAEVGGTTAVLGLVALCAGSSGGDFSDPIVLVVFTVPAWVAGTATRSRAQLAEQLRQRASELEHEREAYAREAIRYERARIARDLHDIVAHNLSMIVVQAAAGRRALNADPTVAAESLRHIQGGAAQAEGEIEQLAGLFVDGASVIDQAGLVAIEGLVQRAAAAGLAVGYTLVGESLEIPPAVASVGFRVAQEGITNALKHAPGAPIEVTVQATHGELTVTVGNTSARVAPTGLEAAGGAHGLSGLRDRVALLGGELRAGPDVRGGWRLVARLPLT